MKERKMKLPKTKTKEQHLRDMASDIKHADDVKFFKYVDDRAPVNSVCLKNWHKELIIYALILAADAEIDNG